MVARAETISGLSVSFYCIPNARGPGPAESF